MQTSAAAAQPVRSDDASASQGAAGVSRRNAIGVGLGALATVAATGLAGVACAQSAAERPIEAPARPTSRRRALRLAHLTDIHVQPERRAEAGMAACLRHVQGQPDRPSLILTGGDHVMDAFDQKQPRSSQLAGLWRDIAKRECSIPIRSCIGNHDIWGWGSAKSGCTGQEPAFGKSYSLELLGLPHRYSSFDQAGWHFVLLDSVQRKGDGYLAQIDDEQWAWLERDLAAQPANVPVLVLSHVPILSVTPQILSGSLKDDRVSVGADLLHGDGVKLHKLFRDRNVRLCLSGHIHLLDRCDVDGVTYICDGAVSGNWWKGIHKGVPEGYGLIDLFDDGSIAHVYVPFGWKAAAE